MNNKPLSIFQFLLENKCSVNAQALGGNPLFYVSEKNNHVPFEIIKYLLEQKADMNCRNGIGETPIYSISQRRDFDVEMLKYFIDVKTDVSVSFSGSSNLLHVLCSSTFDLDVDVVRTLVENNCDINQVDDSRYTPLQMFCEMGYGSLDVLKFLVERDVSLLNFPNEFRDTPLHSAIYNENFSFECIQYLVEMKSDLNATNERHRTVARSALERDHRILNYLLDSGAPLFVGDQNNSVNMPHKNQIILLSQTDYYFDCSLISNYLVIAQDYEKGKLWNTERNKYFSPLFQQKLFNFLVWTKIFSRKVKQIFPKPLITTIIRKVFTPDKQRAKVVKLYYEEENNF